MVDIHSHFLPGIDDGARDAAECAEMLRIAAASGTTHLVATPHADYRFHHDPEVARRLLDEARRAAPPGLDLTLGCDFHLMQDNIEAARETPRQFTLNSSRYLLVELSDMVIFPNTGELFGRLEEAGLRVIISHPERNPLLRQRPSLLREWVDQGRLLQVTASALTGEWGAATRNFARKLLAEGMVHFIASDAHGARGRTPRLDQARRWVELSYGEDFALRLFETNPRAVVEDRDLDPPEVLNCKPVAVRQPLWRRLLGPFGTASPTPAGSPKT